MSVKCFLKGICWIIPLILVSCSENENFMTDDKTQVLFSVDEFVNDNASRTTTDPDNGYLITWAEGDVIGIFPREGYQEPFAIPANQVGKTKATFDGGYWAIKEGLEYNAYYPFDVANFSSVDSKKNIPVTYWGQEQDGTNCNIGAFDYTYSDWKKATNGTISFSFHHIGAICVFSLRYPATTTYTKLTFSVGSPEIPYMGSYNLTASSVAYKPTAYTNEIIMDLKNCSGVAGETGVFYMMLPPMDLSSNTITLKLTSGEGIYTYLLNPLIVVAGKKYELTGIPVGAYAVKSDGSLVLDSDIPENLTDNEKRSYIAVAIIDEEERFMISKSSTIGSWGIRTQTICEKQYTGYRNGMNDMVGKENTDRILSEINLSYSGIGEELISYRKSSAFKDWYIPSAGQMYWRLYYKNKLAIKNVLSKIGHAHTASNYWTSTEYDKDMAWYITVNGDTGYNYKEISSYRVLFMRDF